MDGLKLVKILMDYGSQRANRLVGEKIPGGQATGCERKGLIHRPLHPGEWTGKVPAGLAGGGSGWESRLRNRRGGAAAGVV